jgi:reticulon-4-interacting protein 1, mitochondrial
MNLPIRSLPFPASLRAPKAPCADFSGTILDADAATSLKPNDDVFEITVNPFVGGTLFEVARLPVANTTVVEKPEEWSHVQAASLPLVWLTARTRITCVEPYYVKGHAG